MNHLQSQQPKKDFSGLRGTYAQNLPMPNMNHLQSQRPKKDFLGLRGTYAQNLSMPKIFLCPKSSIFSDLES